MPSKAKPKAAKRPSRVVKGKPAATKPTLLAGGNPQIAKADGDAPVQAYIAAMPGWKRDIGRRLDALIGRNVPNVRKAVRWNSPFYGIEGQGGSSTSIASRSTSRWLSSAARRCVLSHPASPSTRTCATSTSTRTTSSTRRRWRRGSGRRPPCPAGSRSVVARGGIEPPTRGFSVRRRARFGASKPKTAKGFLGGRPNRPARPSLSRTGSPKT